MVEYGAIQSSTGAHMPDRRLQVFHAVAKQMSFTKAAEVLFMTQPAVTFQIKQLEEFYNTRLFERGHGKISLTPGGEVVLEYAERILALTGELEIRLKELTGRLSGPLLIGASTTAAECMLPPILGEFKAQFPEVQARLHVANSGTIESQVAANTLDVGLIEAPSRLPTLLTEPCFEEELIVIVSPRHALADRKQVPAKLLLQYPYISREAGSGTREFTDLYFRKAGIKLESLNVEMELGSPEALKGVVAAGLGFAIMPRIAVEKEIKLRELVALPLEPRLTSTLSLVFPKEKFRSRLVNSFIEFAKARLGALGR